MGTADLRDESGVKDRKAFTRGLDELQAAMIVVPSEVYYQPKFTYIWSLAVGRFPDALRRRVKRHVALVRGSVPRRKEYGRNRGHNHNCALWPQHDLTFPNSKANRPHESPLS